MSAFVMPPWPRPRPAFTCSLCGTKHPCPDRTEWGVWPFPPTMTTERGVGGGWFAHCKSRETCTCCNREVCAGTEWDSLYSACHKCAFEQSLEHWPCDHGAAATREAENT